MDAGHFLKGMVMDGVEANVAGQFADRGGVLLTRPRVAAVFWGEGWKAEAQALTALWVEWFFVAVVAGAFLEQIQNLYGRAGEPFESGTFAGAVRVGDRRIARVVTDAEIRRMLEEWIEGGIVERPGAGTLYFVYPPPGWVVECSEGSSAERLCGYHDSFVTAANEAVYYAVIPYPDVPACRYGLPVEDALTVSSSHELAEALTDPVIGTGWYEETRGEVADACVPRAGEALHGYIKRVDGFVMQRLWSDAAGKCV